MSHFSGNKKKKSIAFRIFRIVLIAIVAVILGAIILIIGVRNYKAINMLLGSRSACLVILLAA